MELSDLREMSAGDLRVKEREAREELFRLRLKLRTNQLDNPSSYRRARKELARILTVIAQKSGPRPKTAGAAGVGDAATS